MKIKDKKRRKAEKMWIEQVFLEIDELKNRISKLEGTVKYISKELDKLKEVK